MASHSPPSASNVAASAGGASTVDPEERRAPPSGATAARRPRAGSAATDGVDPNRRAAVRTAPAPSIQAVYACVKLLNKVMLTEGGGVRLSKAA